MTREEATAIAYGDPKVIILVLMELGARIEELERNVARLTTDSSNSSKPPSSDGPAGKPKARPRLKSKRRKPGGQPGHKGSNRDLAPPEEVDEIIDLFPKTCEHCRAGLTPDSGHDRPTGKYWRHQVWDAPELKPEVVEYRRHCIRCSCGTENWAALPKAVQSGFGPRLTAFLAHLTGLHRVTRRGCREIAKTIFGIDIALGSVCRLHQEVSEALATGHEKAKQALRKQPVLNVDETGWKTQGRRRWLWIFVTPALALYHVAQSRGAKVLRELLGEKYTGILCSDMYSAYNAYHNGLRQYCWAHIIRGLKGLKHACRSPDAVRFATWMLAESGRMFGLWHAYKTGRLDRRTLVRKSVPIRSRMSRCLQRFCASSDADVRRVAKSLLKHWEGLFTFLDHPGVEPTNNSAEQSARPPVQWRKICFGNQSAEGELLTARLLTAERSCILQGRNPFQFLLDCIIAHRNELPLPTLV